MEHAERIEDENLRLRAAAEQALFFAEAVRGRLPPDESLEVDVLITALSQALERPAD